VNRPATGCAGESEIATAIEKIRQQDNEHAGRRSALPFYQYTIVEFKGTTCIIYITKKKNTGTLV